MVNTSLFLELYKGLCPYKGDRHILTVFLSLVNEKGIMQPTQTRTAQIIMINTTAI